MKNVVRFISTKKIFIIAGIILVTVLYILISHKDSPATSASNASKKYYKCITIEEGDTFGTSQMNTRRKSMLPHRIISMKCLR